MYGTQTDNIPKRTRFLFENDVKMYGTQTLREVSPLLGSRSGLSTIEESMEDVAAKIAELVTL